MFTGNISDKVITCQSGFYNTLKELKKHGFVKDGDAIMADKGLSIEQELKDLGLQLNIPPFARTGCQMSAADVACTSKIAKHRIHIERLISRIKCYKIISHKIPTSLFSNINQIWTVCCFLTLFQDGYLPASKN